MTTNAAALEKLQKYCMIQDRCHSEVYQKLRGMGLYHNQANEVVADLIADGFLNEERYSRSFARGKFRMKSWGRIKISAHLRAKSISAKCIELGLQEIDEQEYLESLTRLLSKFLNERNFNLQNYQHKQKAYQHALRKGYESELISSTLRRLSD